MTAVMKRLMIDGYPATTIALADIDEVDKKVDPFDSLYHMDGKLIDDRGACIDAIDGQNLTVLMQHLAFDKQYHETEHEEARPAGVNLLGMTQARIKTAQGKFTAFIDTLLIPRDNRGKAIEMTRKRYFHYSKSYKWG